MRIVLDSNILLVSIGQRSAYKPIWSAFIEGKFQLIISDDIVYEYQEVLEEHAAGGASKIVLEILLESSQVIHQQIYYQWNAITKDPDDNKFFDIAVAGNADYIVTNDAHFNILRQLDFPNVNIIDANGFLDILSKI